MYTHIDQHGQDAAGVEGLAHGLRPEELSQHQMAYINITIYHTITHITI